jgi:hypothetical protein
VPFVIAIERVAEDPAQIDIVPEITDAVACAFTLIVGVPLKPTEEQEFTSVTLTSE